MTHHADANTSYLVAAQSWRLDLKGAEIRASLADAGVPSLLLKGRAFVALLYGDGALRPYADCDLLVPAARRDRAYAVLADIGFAPSEGATHSLSWHREVDGIWIDLHHTLPELDADPGHVWVTLSARATAMTVGNEETRVLDPAAAALLAALHLVHHGPHAPGPREDLERAITLLGDDCWNSAAGLASELAAEAALGTGLRLVPSGVALADRLHLPWAPSALAVLRWRDAPWGARVWESLSSPRSAKARGFLLAAFRVPNADFLRGRSALARSGGCGLAIAYFVRPVHLVVKALMAFGQWRRGRRLPPQPWVQ